MASGLATAAGYFAGQSELKLELRQNHIMSGNILSP